MRKLDGKWRPDYAHIVAYEFIKGERPSDDGLELDHECHEKLCVRPVGGHVVKVTKKENRLRQIRDFLSRGEDGGTFTKRKVAEEGME